MEESNKKGKQENEPDKEEWILHDDETSSIDGAGAGLILTNPTWEDITYALWFDFEASNHESDY